MHTTQTTATEGATIEAMLLPLIQEHGAPTVREHLHTIFGQDNRPDYECVCNFIDAIERRLAHK